MRGRRLSRSAFALWRIRRCRVGAAKLLLWEGVVHGVKEATSERDGRRRHAAIRHHGVPPRCRMPQDRGEENTPTLAGRCVWCHMRGAPANAAAELTLCPTQCHWRNRVSRSSCVVREVFIPVNNIILSWHAKLSLVRSASGSRSRARRRPVRVGPLGLALSVLTAVSSRVK